MLGYRTTHVDVMPFSNGKFGNAKGTLTGVTQLSNFDPYQLNYFNTMAWQGGVNIYGEGDTSVAYNRGDWTGVSNVDFGSGAKSITINAGTVNGSTIRISIDSPSGQVIGYVTIPATGDNWKSTDVTAEITQVSGVKNIFFVASADVVLNTYKFSS
jgi:arabinoxylan arabinofuranohydrolase